MAKKKEDQFSYLQAPLPQGQKKTRTVKVDWSGLNYRQTIDTGALSYEKNISTDEAPYLTPSGAFEEVFSFGDVPHYEYNPVSEQGDYSTQNGLLFNKNKTALYRCPRGKTGKVIIPNSVTIIENYAFQSCNSITDVVLPAIGSIVDIYLLDCASLHRIIIPSGVTAIKQGDLLPSSQSIYASLDIIRIPKSVKSIEVWSMPRSGISIEYEGTEAEWGQISITGNQYWTPLFLAQPRTYNVSYSDVYQQVTDTYSMGATNAGSDFVVDENGVITSYVGSSLSVVIPNKIGNIVTKSISPSFSSTAQITSIAIPSTVLSIDTSGYDNSFQGITSLAYIHMYESTIETTQAAVAVGDKKCVKIYGYNELLAAHYYKADENKVYTGKMAISLLDKDMNYIKFSDDEDYFSPATSYYLDDLPKCSDTAFSVVNSSNIANIVKSDSKKKLLLFPFNYSWDQPNIIEIPYRYDKRSTGSRPLSIYPWAFVDDFIDTECIYNIVVKEGRDTIPGDGEITNTNYLYYNPNYDDTGWYRYRKTNNVIVGLWSYNTTAKAWMPYQYDKTTNTKSAYKSNLPSLFDTTENPCPKFDDVTVFQSRLFGIDNGKVFASEYGNYCGWNLDTSTESNSANAWISLLNANPNADGDLTAIKTYSDRVVVFRENFMHEIRNTKNPFRIYDVYQEGCINKEAAQVVGDKLIFASKNGVKMYTGGNPKDIGINLNIGSIQYAVSGTDGRRLYLYCQTDKKLHNLFVYDNLYGLWSEMEIDTKILCFTNNNTGMFMLGDNNKVYKLNTKDYNHEWAAETDFNLGQTVDIKHIRKIQLFAELDNFSELNVHVLYDEDNFDTLSEAEIEKRLVFSTQNITGASKRYLIRIVPLKSANYGFKIRISGTGYAKVYQMEVTLTGGGELFGNE